MGFFDDLDNEVNPGMDTGNATGVDHDDFSPVLNKLREGWHWSDIVTKPGKDKQDKIEEQIHISFETGRFVHEICVVHWRGKDESEITAQERRLLDKDGIIELFVDQPGVGQKILAAARTEGGGGGSTW